MKKQKWLLFNLGAYIVGIATGLLIKNYNVLFALMAIPTFFVFLRGAINENKWNKALKEIEDKLSKEKANHSIIEGGEKK